MSEGHKADFERPLGAALLVPMREWVVGAVCLLLNASAAEHLNRLPRCFFGPQVDWWMGLPLCFPGAAGKAPREGLWAQSLCRLHCSEWSAGHFPGQWPGQRARPPAVLQGWAGQAAGESCLGFQRSSAGRGGLRGDVDFLLQHGARRRLGTPLVGCRASAGFSCFRRL